MFYRSSYFTPRSVADFIKDGIDRDEDAGTEVVAVTMDVFVEFKAMHMRRLKP